MTAESPLFGASLRAPPENQQAEQALLGALLANNAAFDRVGFLRPDHFYDPLNGKVFEAIARRIHAGQVADAITLKAEFEGGGDLEEVGGVKYLAQLLTAMVGIINAGEYGRSIFEAWQRRKLIEIGTALVDTAFSVQEPPSDLAASFVAQIEDLTATGTSKRAAVSLDDAMAAAIEAAEHARQCGGVIGLRTGLRSLDTALGGLEPGAMIVLAGRPGMGKSALGLGIAVDIARMLRAQRAAGETVGGVAVISLEMTAQQLGRRVLSAASGIPQGVIRRGELSSADGDRLVRTRRERAGLPLHIDDIDAQTVAQIRAQLQRMRRKLGGLALIVLDHLHIVRPEKEDTRQGATWAVGRISNAMKAIAKHFNCPVLVLAQLNRSTEGREDKRPTLADLRQSGEIEQDADAVALLFRAEYYLAQQRPELKPGDTDEKHAKAMWEWERTCDAARGKAELIFAKVRDGEPQTVHLAFDGATTSFRDIE